MNNRSYTKAEHSLITRLRAGGATYNEIASRLGRSCSGASLGNYARRKGIVDVADDCRARGMSERKANRLATILEMWNSGVTGTQIGRAVDLPRGSVQRIIWAARRDGYKVADINDVEFRRRTRVGQTLYDRVQ